MAQRKKPYSIALSPFLVKEIDQISEQRSMSRSEFVGFILWQTIEDYKEEKKKGKK